MSYDLFQTMMFDNAARDLAREQPTSISAQNQILNKWGIAPLDWLSTSELQYLQDMTDSYVKLS